MDYGDSPVDYRERLLVHQTEFFKVQFGYHGFSLDLPYMLASETVQLHLNSPSKIKVSRRIRFLQPHRGLLIFFSTMTAKS